MQETPRFALGDSWEKHGVISHLLIGRGDILKKMGKGNAPAVLDEQRLVGEDDPLDLEHLG